jgi:transcriptional regulator with XRE-family HTH domain
MLQTTMKRRPVKTVPNPTQQDLALRLRHAMDESDISLTLLAKECGVTPQAIYDWRNTGRIGKQHLVTIARVTRKPLEYFLMGLRAALLLIALTLAPQQAEAGILHNVNYHPALYTLYAAVRRALMRLMRGSGIIFA